MTRTKWTLSGLALASLMACSGGSKDNPPPPPPPKTIADRLDYTNPTSGTYTLVKDTTLSTPAHLVLNLMGPVGTQGTGVGFYLSADTSKVTWAKPASSDSILARNGVFDLGTSPQLAVAKAAVDSQSNQTGQIQVGFYQKGTTKPAVTFTASTVLASVALDMKSSVSLGTVTFSAVSNKALLTNGSAAPTPIVISTGTLAAN